VNPQTYQLCLKGRAQVNRSTTPEEFKKGVALLEQAVEKDPNEPLAWSGLAAGYVMAEHQGMITGALQKAIRAANKAIEVDPTLAEAHLAMAMIKGYDQWDYDGAVKEYKTAIELNPNLADAHGHYSWLLLANRRNPRQQAELQEGEIRHAQEIDPNNPMFYWWMGQRSAKCRPRPATRKACSASRS